MCYGKGQAYNSKLHRIKLLVKAGFAVQETERWDNYNLLDSISFEMGGTDVDILETAYITQTSHLNKYLCTLKIQ